MTGGGGEDNRPEEELQRLRRRVAELEARLDGKRGAGGVFRKKERYYRSLIRNTGEMISVYDARLHLIWGNRSAALITGWYLDDFKGRTLLDFIHPEDREKSSAFFREVFRRPGVPLHTETRFRHRDGLYHHHEAIVTNLLEDPDVRGIVVNSRDVSSRKEIEKALRERNRELEIFARTISHDLRTPLSLISGYAQLLAAGDLEKEERHRYLEQIVKSAERLEKLTEALLDYAQAGKPEGLAERVEPGRVMKEVLSDYALAVEERGARVSVAEDIPDVMVDAWKLRQVLGNLLDNALKHGGDRSPLVVTLSAEIKGDRAIFKFRDNGAGIPPDVLEDIFMPFFRLENSGESPGLGLATVKHAVEGWGGRVWAESEPGKGTTFYFTAPLAE
jgi:PAS domain S-box-containing protein